ncbi:ThuA domain-containing protein [Phenylobacterium montanum]|uniref:ThuA domain-containing protein n=1 Tax=Phenylobacterium montanum TaxID=2823693 RepID=A0A975IYJ2_9CAUL|nr:ThuA domain-containing protein [Caulobacter sp. S6]QUD90511.1 ThuA domain-containing protein [Caulobacter sp. S6]
MPVVRYGQPLNVMVAAKGHPYQRDPFMAMFDDLPGVACTLVEQPLAARLMNPDGMKGFDALVLYDMPGLDFGAADRPAYVEPDEAFKAGFLALLDRGIGVVALHHAIAGWPAWPEYAELLGGRFLYKPGPLLGSLRPDSGYRHDVVHTVEFADPGHPVVSGLPQSFALTDELYLFEVFEDLVTPLLRSGHAFTRDGFYSASQAVAGRMFSNEGWAHADGSNLVGWTKRARNSPLVYLQPGDGPSTYADPNYRRLIENAIRWAAAEARA